MSYRDVLAGMQDALLPDADKATILARQGGLCFYCDQPLSTKISWDHFVPRHARGPHHLNNRVAAHPGCDCKKGGRMPTDVETEKFLDQTAST